ncbi:uncharacterized protein Fot_52403 [Forsythia ovata]|uniref:DUF1985 domain-containing protein n=1 Tax=Forsythia ovata TaxID=205694 RepID=A0ABD1PKL9_9LAMI
MEYFIDVEERVRGKISNRDVNLKLSMRTVRTLKENEVWCKFGNKIARFGLEEFVLVTGLKAGELESEDENLGLKSDLIQKYFKKSKGKVVRRQLLNAFRRCGNQPDKFKMGLLLILAYVLLSAEENTNLLLWFNLVDNFGRFNNYAWERDRMSAQLGYSIK